MKMLASEHVLVQWERTTNGLYAVCIGCGDHHHNVRRIGDEVGPGENSLETEARPPFAAERRSNDATLAPTGPGSIRGIQFWFLQPY